MDIKEFISREKARGDGYRLLSACFYQPEKDLFLQEGLFKNLASVLEQISPDASAAVGEMEKEFSRYGEEELTVDYAKLFVGPNELIAPPFGSVYLDTGRRVIGDSTMEVIRMYEEQGLVMDKEFRNLPDHITAELEFMSYLIARETEALEKSDMDGAHNYIGIQEQFLDRFLRKWVPPLCDKMKAGAESGFYKVLADLTAAFIRGEHPGAGLPEGLRNINARA